MRRQIGESTHDLQQAERLTPELTHAHHGARLVTRDLLQLSCARGPFPRGQPLIRHCAGWPCQPADHPLEAADFEGVHQGQARGSGAVIIWDEGPAAIDSSARAASQRPSARPASATGRGPRTRSSLAEDKRSKAARARSRTCQTQS
jgi:hypothetical protein